MRRSNVCVLDHRSQPRLESCCGDAPLTESARSSDGQSSGFLNRRSEVRVLPGVPERSFQIAFTRQARLDKVGSARWSQQKEFPATPGRLSRSDPDQPDGVSAGGEPDAPGGSISKNSWVDTIMIFLKFRRDCR